MALDFPVTVPAPAKINLCLLILGRRTDGYHNLQTAFQLLNLQDDLLFEADAEFSISGMADTPLSDNLIYRAAALLMDKATVPATGKITVSKRIPMGAGLGGGSSNAATALVALNQLWRCGLTCDELANLGARLGADVPVFVRGYSAWGEGVGESLTPLELPSASYLLIYPNCHVATSEVFAHPDLTRDSQAITIARFLSLGAGNDCENIVCRIYPEVARALDWLKQKGPAKMTGTGSCVFLRCRSSAEAIAIQREVPSEWQSFVAEGVNRSPLSFFEQL
jgi:4-diphosphocytidyl-2-C-methyl-D-erythritol kinase